MIFYKRYSFGGVQFCGYPFEVMGLSQLMNVGPSHWGRLAIDEAGRDVGKCRAGAPFDAVVLWKKSFGSKTGILITNKYPTLFADHKVHPARDGNALFWHDDDTSDINVGDVILQGTPFYDEGTADNASGNHVHMMVSFREWDGSYPMEYLPAYGTYSLKNAVEPYNFFFINDTIRRRDGGYPWKEFVFPDNAIPLKYLLKVTTKE